MSSGQSCNICKKYYFVISGEKITGDKDILLCELGHLVENFEHFLSSYVLESSTPSEIIVRLTELIVNFGLVRTFDHSEDRDFDSRDFPIEGKNAVESFKYLNYLLKQYNSLDTASKRKFLVQVLLLCATHNSNYFWTSEESITSCKDFLHNLLKCTTHNELSILLLDDTFHPTLFKAILKFMRPNLMKETWMKNPSYCHIFYWLLSQVKHPHLLDYLYDVLPPPFMFADYYSIPHQVLGIKCFDHILDNVPPTLIKSDGTEDAIFHTLKKYIYSKDVPVVEVLYPCLLKLPMMNLQKVDHLQWLQFDVVLQQLLQHADMESSPKLRYLFLSQTYLFIKCTPCFKHLKKTLHVLLRNFVINSVAEEKCRVASLKIIKELIRSCWPRMENHCYDILLAILKALCDIENPGYSLDETISKEILSLSGDSLSLLKHACPDTFNTLVNEYIQKDDSMPGVSLLKGLT